jgi:hypothetical protein
MSDDTEDGEGGAEEVSPSLLEPVTRLSKDIIAAAHVLSDDEARFLVDAYYQMQENRIRSDAQVRSMNESGEPNDVLRWLGHQSSTLENQIKRALGRYADSKPLGEWAQSVVGIGPVIAAGLLAHISFEPWKCNVPLDERKARHKCNAAAPCTDFCGKEPIHTVGHLWRFAGLDPTQKWEKGKKRPWNATLKTLCWKIGESFVKVSGNEHAFYGKVYVARKAYEIARNEAGGCAAAAQGALQAKKFNRETEAKKHYEAGRLPPAHIHARAKRYAVKLFLAHYHEVGYRLLHGVNPPLPYPIAILGHAHKIPVPM